MSTGRPFSLQTVFSPLTSFSMSKLKMAMMLKAQRQLLGLTSFCWPGWVPYLEECSSDWRRRQRRWLKWRTPHEAFKAMISFIYTALPVKCSLWKMFSAPKTSVASWLWLTKTTNALASLTMKNELGKKEMPKKTERTKRRHSCSFLDTTREEPVLDHSILPSLPE